MRSTAVAVGVHGGRSQAPQLPRQPDAGSTEVWNFSAKRPIPQYKSAPCIVSEGHGGKTAHWVWKDSAFCSPQWPVLIFSGPEIARSRRRRGSADRTGAPERGGGRGLGDELMASHRTTLWWFWQQQSRWKSKIPRKLCKTPSPPELC